MKRLLLGGILSLALFAHPMGNFSISRCSRLTLAPQSVRLDYILDFAEIPTFQELQAMGADLTNKPGGAELQRWAESKAPEWLDRLELTAGGQRAPWRLIEARAEFVEGVGGLPTLKVFVKAEAQGTPGEVFYRDHNFVSRAGWKEIVVRANGVRLEGAESFAADLSQALSRYPEDTSAPPPQMVEASFRVLAQPPPAALATPASTPAKTAPVAPPAPVAEPAVETAKPVKPGLPVNGDPLSEILSTRQLSGRIVLLALGVAFCLGAFHALSPGHGKTIVAAYLVGSRGTVKHALFLGGVVTLAHTMGVFALGIAVVLAGPRLVPERLYPWLGMICGLSIVGIGIVMFHKRWAALRHGHHHDVYHHNHHHNHHDHHHHDHGHSHQIPDKVTWGSLLALGVSGGILPCPSALVVLLAAISLNRAALGVLLIVSFSLGLAVVLSGIGVAMVQARSLFDRLPVNTAFARRLPVLSSAVVSVLGLGIALQALMTVLGSR